MEAPRNKQWVGKALFLRQPIGPVVSEPALGGQAMDTAAQVLGLIPTDVDFV